MTTELFRLNYFLGRRPVVLMMLTLWAVIFFLAVTVISRAFQAQQESLAVRWAGRGTKDLNAQHFPDAVADFRTALLYDRDNYYYRLSLAQSLLGLNRTGEASSYLMNLWEEQPENGFVNLELARIAASQGDTGRALRFYHNAIYATWPADQHTESRNTRFELIGYLLGIHANTEAQAELIAIEANLGEDSPLQVKLGNLFLQVQDNQYALAAFQRALRHNRHDQAALAGAGTAAYGLGRYPDARHYLEQALAIAPDDQQSAEWLHKTSTVLALDPYRPQIGATDRARIALQAFTVAGARLKSCAASGAAAATAMQGLSREWDNLRQSINPGSLQRDTDRASQTMNLAISIEHQAASVCGTGSEDDQALLLIANLREEN